MNSVINSAILVGIAAIVTLALRAIPFILFGGDKKLAPSVKRAVDLLPAAIMGVLVIYCVKGDILSLEESFSTGVEILINPISTVVALVVVIALHMWKRMTLLSIFAGTFVYMLLIRVLPQLLV